MSYEIFNKVDKTFVINLKKDTLRKQHVTKSFKSRKIDFELIEAVEHDSPDVKSLYAQDKVFEFPPCFRCKLNKCSHENNFITPKQVANFLSFKKIMKKITDEKIYHVQLAGLAVTWRYDSTQRTVLIESICLLKNKHQ